jgi:pimeloyl-ACP methyl ester carboxylesterase
LPILRALFALISLIVLALAVYLLWTWYKGDLNVDPQGTVYKARDEWRLWVGLGLLAWSFLGRLIVPLLLARTDSDPLRLEEGSAQMLKSSSGAELHVETFGPATGQPIILTHGWSLDSRIWFYTKRELSKRYRVVVWDLPGLGKSRRAPGGAIHMSGFAQDLAAVIGQAGGRPAVLVGHSIGGMVIQTLARDHPELFGREVSGVVLLNTTYTNPLHTMILSGLARAIRWPILEPMMRLQIWLQPLVWLSSWQSYLSGSSHIATRLGFGRHVTRSQLDRTTLLLTLSPPAVSARGDLAMFRWDSATALASANVPVLIIGGSVDIITKPEASRTIAAAVPHAQLRIVEGANHMGVVECADEYNMAIAMFAESLSKAPQGSA